MNQIRVKFHTTQFHTSRWNKIKTQNKADFLVSMDQMKATLPNLKWVSLVVTWFTDSTNIATANIYPAH